MRKISREEGSSAPAQSEKKVAYLAMKFSHEFSDWYPLDTKYHGVDYAPIACFFTEKELHHHPCFITLANMPSGTILKNCFDPEVKPPEKYVDDPVGYGLFSLKNHLLYRSYERDISFTPQDIREGLALYLIQALREYRDELAFVEQINMLAEILDGEFIVKNEREIQPILEKIFLMIGRSDFQALKAKYGEISRWSKRPKS